MTVKPPNDGLNGLAPIEPKKPFVTMPNAAHQTFHGFMTGASYQLAIVEFDDQGRCYDRGQMDGISQTIDDLMTQESDVILLVFVHGWKHDARTDDANLSAFRILLAKTVEHEKRTAPTGTVPRPVLGIFVGWRGLSEYGIGDAIADATFWGRQAAGQRVATGSARELFGRLRRYRNHRKEDGSPLLVIAGHSFGGMIVYSALAQSLIEAVSTPTRELVPSFADLVLLVNPAIEGARYLPMQDLVCSDAFKERTIAQLPVFICAQAENDQPVGTFFPIGNVGNRLDEATIGELEKDCVTHAIGVVPAFRTHKLSGPASSKPFILQPPGGEQVNPFWVVSAKKELIDGHGGIWQQPFLLFLASVICQHVKATRQTPADPGSNRSAEYGSHPDDLAEYAKIIGPINLSDL